MVEYIDNDDIIEDNAVDLSELIESNQSQNTKKELRSRQVENRWKLEEILAQKRLKEKDRDPFEEDMD